MGLKATFAQIPTKKLRVIDRKVRLMSPGLLRLSRFSSRFRPFWHGCTNIARMKSTDNPKLGFVVVLALVDDKYIIENGTKRNIIIRGLLAKLQ